jgi:hypothetical protein
MNLADHPLLSSFTGRPAILDSNLLLLDWCAGFDDTLIRSFKRLSSFERLDAVLLSEVMKLFPSVWTTPHILTEVSNLTTSLPSWRKDDWCRFYSEKVRLLPEIYAPSSEIVSDLSAIRFGLTDTALVRLAATHVVLTIDWPLSNLLESRKLLVINFTHLREAFLLS